MFVFQVSNNRVFNAPGVNVSFFPAPILTEIIPRSGTIHGTTMITIIGENFLYDYHLFCKFGSKTVIVKADYVSDSELHCKVRPSYDLHIGAVEVYLTNMDEQFYSDRR